MWKRLSFTTNCVAGALATFALGGCAGSGAASDSADTLTIYNGQHEEVTQALVAAFQKKTGITVHVRNGEGPELANQILAERSVSPADVIFTENSPEITLLARKGRLAKVDAATLAKVPASDSSPQGQWVGFAARATALAYDPRQLTESQLPRSVLDLARPTWRGRLGIAPVEGDFQPLVTAVSLAKGEAAAKQWLAGLKRNSQVFQNNTAILMAVNSGQLAVGLINQHYWFRLRAANSAGSLPSKLYYFGHQDPGALVNISGVGVLSSSKHAKSAQQFLAFLVSAEGQRTIVGSKDYEYPIAADVAADPVLKPFDTLDPPTVGVAQLGDGTRSIELLRQAGLL
jgi:iron(III) transport system substrate-binding protein